MARRVSLIGFVLAAMLHVDWHMARPLHHRLSLGLADHWIITAVVFAIVGCLIARLWPVHRWQTGGASLAIALVVAQLLEPVGTSLFYDHRFAYDVMPERWVAFGETLAASIPAYFLTLWLCVKRAPRPLGESAPQS